MTASPVALQCGRCRERFSVDADEVADPPAKWWLCGPCRLAFFGAHPRRSALAPAESSD